MSDENQVLPRSSGPWLPAPVLRNVGNFTRLRHLRFQKMGKGRVYYDCLVMQATFDLASGKLVLSQEQAPIALADEHHDETAQESSLAMLGALHLPKPGADVIVTGSACSPGRRPLDRWRCEVTVRRGQSTLLQHAVIATGRRYFLKSGLGWSVSDAKPVDAVPLRYELAYGGHFLDESKPVDDDDRVRVHAENPSGTGFFSRQELARRDALPAPQWELPDQPIRGPNTDSPLAGFGPVARGWLSRSRYGGTYDAGWHARLQEDLARGVPPDYPEDFDARYFHGAHPKLRAPEPFQGDERIELAGFFADAPLLAFELPGLTVSLDVLPRGQDWSSRAMALDLVHVDLDASRVKAQWRIAFDPAEGITAAGVRAGEARANTAREGTAT